MSAGRFPNVETGTLPCEFACSVRESRVATAGRASRRASCRAALAGGRPAPAPAHGGRDVAPDGGGDGLRPLRAGLRRRGVRLGRRPARARPAPPLPLTGSPAAYFAASSATVTLTILS